MKVYVIPVEKICNGKCKFCITKFRKTINSDFLEPTKLKHLSKFQNITKIEITGGGEPSLHPKINEIINLCVKIAKTSIYTNGTLNPPLNKDLEICLSRIHYDNNINELLMGIKYNLKKFKFNTVKLSLILHKEGINSPEEIIKYLSWAKANHIQKVVIRKIAFNNDWHSYEIAKKYSVEIENKIINQIKNNFGNFVEFDLASCNLNNADLILRSDGKIYLDWDSSNPISDHQFLLAYLKKIALTSTCLGRKVSSIIIKNEKIIGIGSNSNSDCLIRKVCNRVLIGKNEDYDHCLCTHAEVSAINDALAHNNDLSNSKMLIYGHHTLCPHCQKLLDAYNITGELIS